MYELGLMIRENGWRHLLAETLPPNPRGGIGDEADRLLEYREQVCFGGPNDPSLQNLFRRVNGASSPEQFWVSYFQYMVLEIRRFQATDERDQIYAALALAKRFLPPNMADPLLPDYSLAPNQIYTSAAQVFMRDIPFLSSLSYVEDPSRRKVHGLPSWVPDYSSAQGRVPFVQLGDSNDFDASRAKVIPRERVEFGNRFRSVHLNGAIFDKIFSFCPAVSSLRTAFMVMPYLTGCLAIPAIYKPTGQDRVEALWRTLIADTSEQYPKLHPAPSEYGQHFRNWLLTQMVAYLSTSKSRFSQRYDHYATLRELSASYEANPNNHPIIPTEIEVLDAIGAETIHILRNSNSYWRKPPTPDLYAAKGFHIFDQAVKEVMADRRLFFTEGGNIGLGPKSLKEGDEVWLLEGAQIPFILKPIPRVEGEVCRALVGEAYLHGWMHGEMLDTDLRKRIAPVKII